MIKKGSDVIILIICHRPSILLTKFVNAELKAIQNGLKVSEDLNRKTVQI